MKNNLTAWGLVLVGGVCMSLAVPASRVSAAKTVLLKSDPSTHVALHIPYDSYPAAFVDWPKCPNGKNKVMPWIAQYKTPFITGDDFIRNGDCSKYYYNGGSSAKSAWASIPGPWIRPDAYGGWGLQSSSVGAAWKPAALATVGGIASKTAPPVTESGVTSSQIWTSNTQDIKPYFASLSPGQCVYGNGTSLFRGKFTLTAAQIAALKDPASGYDIEFSGNADDWYHTYINGISVFGYDGMGVGLNKGSLKSNPAIWKAFLATLDPAKQNVIATQVVDKSVWFPCGGDKPDGRRTDLSYLLLLTSPAGIPISCGVSGATFTGSQAATGEPIGARVTMTGNAGSPGTATVTMTGPAGFAQNWSGAFVPNGPNSWVFVTPMTNAGPPGTYTVQWSYNMGACASTTFKVYSKPYFQSFGGDLRVGADYSGALSAANSAPGSASLLGFVRSGVGSSNQLALFAAAKIDQVVSGAGSAVAINPPKSLAFANTTAGSPIYGGEFGTIGSMPDYSMVVGTETHIGTYIFTGDSALTGRRVIIVSGDVYITGDIVYDGAAWSLTTMPSFTLISKGGNVYIDRNVAQLDGTYVAVPKPSGQKGVVYTCAVAAAIPSSSDVATSCGNTLTINGSFVSKQTKLLRWKNGIDSVTAAGAGERFVYSPESWLPRGLSTGTGSLKYDSATSLPPVL